MTPCPKCGYGIAVPSGGCPRCSGYATSRLPSSTAPHPQASGSIKPPPRLPGTGIPKSPTISTPSMPLIRVPLPGLQNDYAIALYALLTMGVLSLGLWGAVNLWSEPPDNASSSQTSNQQLGIVNTPVPASVIVASTTPPVPAPIPPGPSFDEMDDHMNDQVTSLTSAQKTSYWQSIQGTQITWTGVLEEASMNGDSGSIQVRCSRRSNNADVSVNVVPDQVSRLGQLSRGQRVTFTGIIDSYGSTFYNVTNGRIEGL